MPVRQTIRWIRKNDIPILANDEIVGRIELFPLIRIHQGLQRAIHLDAHPPPRVFARKQSPLSIQRQPIGMITRLAICDHPRLRRPPKNGIRRNIRKKQTSPCRIPDRPLGKPKPICDQFGFCRGIDQFGHLVSNDFNTHRTILSQKFTDFRELESHLSASQR